MVKTPSSLNVRIYKTSDGEVVITDHTHRVLYNREGTHDVEGEISKRMLAFGNESDHASSVYQPGTIIYYQNVHPENSPKSNFLLTQMLHPKPSTRDPTIVSATVIPRSRYDAILVKYQREMKPYEAAVKAALDEYVPKIDKIQEEAAKRVQELEEQRRNSLSKIGKPELDLEGLLKL